MQNLTPHPLTFRQKDDREFTIPPSSLVARVAMAQKPVGSKSFTYDGEFYDVPIVSEPQPGEIVFEGEGEVIPGAVVVSIVAAPHLRDARPDLRVYSPDTGPESVCRDNEGRIIAVRRLIFWAPPATSPRIRLILPHNPDNPGDGWKELGEWSLSRSGIERARADAGTWAAAEQLWTMYLVDGWQPIAAYGSDDKLRTVDELLLELEARRRDIWTADAPLRRDSSGLAERGLLAERFDYQRFVYQEGGEHDPVSDSTWVLCRDCVEEGEYVIPLTDELRERIGRWACDRCGAR